MTDPFDASLYIRAPIINIANGVTLAQALVSACPHPAPKNVVKSCGKLKEAAEAAQKAMTARRRENGTISEEDGRVIDREADASFSAFRMRLAAYAMLPVERFPKAKRAGELVTELFGDDGLQFLASEYSMQNTVMASIVQHIEEAKLQKELDAIAGPEFLQQIGHVLPRYREMVRDKLQREAASTSNLSAFVRAIQSAIVDHATKVSGMVDEDEPETLEVVRKALRPIDVHRENVARRVQSGGGAKDEAPPAAPAATPDDGKNSKDPV